MILDSHASSSICFRYGPGVQRFAAAGRGIVHLCDDWLHSHFGSGALEPML
jgi:hypothetical protein